MKIYRVGGAVRDQLLGLPVHEQDWVVVGSTPQQMSELGYRQVGKDFPVFLHPRTGEEYALARTERKTGPGYHGFEFDTTASVTLEQDLSRRDLTINAIAQDQDGRLIDPYGGRTDLEARQLRHVSPAFAEDPVRILRVARFAARLAPLGFGVAAETLDLMRSMVQDGEVDNLVPERVWQEMSKALASAEPASFVRTLRDCGALAVILPEVDRLFGIPQPARHHPEIDCGEHLLLTLAQTRLIGGSAEVAFALLCHDLGKALTPVAELPAHRGHEHRAGPLIDTICDRLRVPRTFRELARVTAKYHLLAHRALELRPETLVRLLAATDAWRRPDRFELFLRACEADARGRGGCSKIDYPQAAHLQKARAISGAIDAAAIAAGCKRTSAIAAAVKRARIDALRQGLDRN